MTTALLPMLLDLDVKHHLDAYKAECAKVRASLPRPPMPSFIARGGTSSGGVGFVTSVVMSTGGGGGAGSIGNTPPRPASGHDATLVSGVVLRPL